MAGLDTLPDAQAIARLVKTALGEDARELRPLGAGESTIAWRVEVDHEPLVVLHARPGVEWPPHLAAQLALLDALHPLDDRVPRAIAWSGDEGLAGLVALDLEWAIVTEAAGASSRDRAPSPEAARDLGTLLARLHALPATGFGRLEHRRDALQGRATDMTAGLLDRWPALWPLDGAPLIARPIARVAPRLLEPLSRLQEPLLRFGALSSGVLLHGDLNPEHVRVDADRGFASLIDFGDAFVGPPAADVATFAFFFGWERAAQLLEGYSTRPLERDMRLAEAHLFAFAYAVHRVNRATAEGGDRHVARAIEFAEETLPLLSHVTREI